MSNTPPPSILIVEDNPDHAILARKALLREAGDRKVVVAHNATEAIQRLERESFDLILCDYDLPKINGVQFIHEARRNGFSIPIVMVTGLGSEKVAAEAMKAGAYDYITKTDNYLENLHHHALRAHERYLIESEKERLELQLVEHVRALERTNRELQKLEKLKDNMTSMIVHDLKGPATVIKSVLRMLDQPEMCDSAAMRDRLLAMGRRNVEFLLGMIQDLLDINRLEEGRLELELAVLDMNDPVREIVEFLEPWATENGVQLHFQEEPDPPPVLGDQEKLRRVVMNLIRNAVSYSPRGGSIDIRVVPRGSAGEVLVEVVDQGPGIPEELQERIFEKFFQIQDAAQRRRNSSGLGLNFCQLVLEAHGGRIWVESAPGSGSRFLFTLPVKRPESELRQA